MTISERLAHPLSRTNRNKIIACAAGLVVIGVGAFFVLTRAATPVTAYDFGVSIPGNRLAFESQTQLDSDMARTAALGVKWVRFDFTQEQVETSQNMQDWTRIDRMVASARSHGLNVLAVIGSMPGWARPAGTQNDFAPQNDAQRTAFANLAAKAAARYANDVKVWEIWNEPNGQGSWKNPDVALYTQLLKKTYPAIKAAAPDATVIAGGTGWPSSPGEIPTTDWYEGLYANGGKGYFDAANVHPYSDFNDITDGEMANAKKVRVIMEKNGDGAKAIWATEAGSPTDGGANQTEAANARMVTEAYDYWATVPNHGPFFWYTLMDTNKIGTGDREEHFGLIRSDDTLKPAYGTLKNYIASHITTTASPKDTVAPSVPTNVLSASQTAVSINLSWTASKDAVSVTAYQVLRNGTQIATTTNPAYNDTGLTAGTAYTYSITAQDAAGNKSAPSAALNVATPKTGDTLAPSRPAVVSANVSGTQVNLSWQAATDNVAVKGYDILRDNQQIGTSIATSYADAATVAGKSYTYTVRTRDGAGNISPLSDAVKAIVPARPVAATQGLLGTYFSNMTLSGKGLARSDANVNFNWAGGSPMSGIPADKFSVRWAGTISPALSNTYSFYTKTDDGARLWVNDKLIIDDWKNHATRETAGKKSIYLSAGVKYGIKMEYYENGGGANAKLLWSSKRLPKQTVPTTVLENKRP